MRLAMEYAKMTGILLIQHCEDHTLSAGSVMNEGVNSTLLGVKGDPGLSESVIVARDIELSNYLGVRIHFAHMSLKRSIELIRAAKEQGLKVTAEACPHHFTLTDAAIAGSDKFWNTDGRGVFGFDGAKELRMELMEAKDASEVGHIISSYLQNKAA